MYKHLSFSIAILFCDEIGMFSSSLCFLDSMACSKATGYCIVLQFRVCLLCGCCCFWCVCKLCGHGCCRCLQLTRASSAKAGPLALNDLVYLTFTILNLFLKDVGCRHFSAVNVLFCLLFCCFVSVLFTAIHSGNRALLHECIINSFIIYFYSPPLSACVFSPIFGTGLLLASTQAV